MERRRRRIETVLVGNARVKIYRRTRTVAGHKYLTYEVCDYTSGHRQLRGFADHQAARKEARRIAGWLAKGDAVAAAVSGREAASFARCLELLRRVGDPPELACARYAGRGCRRYPCSSVSSLRASAQETGPSGEGCIMARASSGATPAFAPAHSSGPPHGLSGTRGAASCAGIGVSVPRSSCMRRTRSVPECCR